jgi:PKD repeat protein
MKRCLVAIIALLVLVFLLPTWGAGQVPLVSASGHPVAQPLSSTTVTIYSEAEDGELAKSNCGDWNSCSNASSSTDMWSTQLWGTVQAVFDSSYHVKRLSFFFDTSTIPANAHVESAVLNVYAGPYQSGSTTVHVVRSTASMPLSMTDFSHIQFSTGGSATASPNSWMSINLNTPALDWVAKGGITRLALIHDLDLRNSVPTVSNSIIIALTENTQYRPYLIVTFSTTLVDDSTFGYYNNALGTVLDGTQPQFPPANHSGGDPTIFPAAEPDLASAASILGGWLSSNPLPLNANWSGLQAIPKSWAANTENAIIYPVDAGTQGFTRVIGNFGVDNGIFVWVNGQYKFGALAPGAVNGLEYTNVDLGSFPPGLNYIQILREDHGDFGGFTVYIITDSAPPPSTSTISGRVTDVNNNAVSGATVSATGPTNNFTTTDNNGSYTLSNLTADTYTITSAKNGYTFSPSSRSVSVPPDKTGVDFTGTLQIDLEVTTIEPTIQPICSGSSPFFQASIRNNGLAASGPFNIRWNADGQVFIGGHDSIPPGATDTHSHSWQNVPQGQHTLTFTADSDNFITESNENNNQKTITFTAVNCTPAPVANFDAWPLSGNPPLTVSMHNTSTGNYTSCLWDYGDGTTGTSCDAYHDHTYTAAGSYSVKLTVSGPGGSDTKIRSNYVTVSSAPPPNDPLFSQQWYLSKIDILGAWSRTKGSSDVVIAVIDTGVDYNHVDLGGGKTLTTNDRDYVTPDEDAMDNHGHGTHVAGIAAANTNNGQGIAGICPQCRILPLKTANIAGTARITDTASAIRYATDQGASVINLSLTGDNCTPDLADAVNYAYERHVVLVAAAGDACPVKVALGWETFDVGYPALFERVIAVGATQEFDWRAVWSAYGPSLDISAPGYSILSTKLGGGYERRDGTSQAAPMVAGVAGLIRSKNPLLTPTQVQKILETAADDIDSPGWDQYTGWGRLNASRALATTIGPVSSVPPVSCSTSLSSSSGIRTSEDNLISLYRQLRDEVLLSSTVGQEYVKDYYRYSPELVAILLTDSNMRTRTAQFLDHAAPAFRSLLPNSIEEVALTQVLYDEADGLVRDLANAGSPEFRDKTLQTWQDLSLDEHIGQTATEIWEQMQLNPVYLPIIIKND